MVMASIGWFVALVTLMIVVDIAKFWRSTWARFQDGPGGPSLFGNSESVSGLQGLEAPES